jgi:hypothetical protein
MEERDLFDDILKNKLDNLDSPVRADIWSNVSSSISTSSATVGAGISALTKIAIGVSVVAATVTSVLYYSIDKNQHETETIETPKQPTENKKETTTSTEIKETIKKEEIKNQTKFSEVILNFRMMIIRYQLFRTFRTKIINLHQMKTLNFQNRVHWS